MKVGNAIVAVCGAAVLAIGASGCDGPTSTSEQTTASGTPASVVEGQAGQNEGGKVDVHAEIGDCLALTGTEKNANAKKKDCTDKAANYRVVSKAKDENGCPKDVSQIYYELNHANNTTGALCLDRNWREDTCYVKDQAAKEYVAVECTRPGALKYVTTVAGKTAPEDCPDPADTGISYDTRNFIVCFQEMKGGA